MPYVELPGLREKLRRAFEWFHRHPEISYQEFETTARIRAFLEEAGVRVLDTPLKTGLAAEIRGGKPGPVVALRADIDALPIGEETGLSYQSERAGVMHACGHDFHTTALLGAAIILQECRSELAGAVTLIFQPAEEQSGGARSVLDTGVLDSAREIYGLHVWPSLKSGVVAIKDGPAYAAALRCELAIRGAAGHAAYPQLCRDPIVACAALITAAQTVVSRNTSPFEQAVLSFTRVEGGSAWNLIPGQVRLEGTIRALGTEQAGRAASRLEQICRGIEAAFDVSVTPAITLDTPSVENDAALCAFARKAARDAGFTVLEGEGTMGAEDFALYQRNMPGVFFGFGVESPYGWHHPRFAARPDALFDAAALLALLARKALERLGAAP